MNQLFYYIELCVKEKNDKKREELKTIISDYIESNNYKLYRDWLVREKWAEVAVNYLNEKFGFGNWEKEFEKKLIFDFEEKKDGDYLN